MNRITNNLWITDIQSVREHRTDNFDLVVSVCQDKCEENVSSSTRYCQFSLADGPENEEAWGGSASYGSFKEAVNHVVWALNRGEIVLVHCHSGQNRSAAVCTSALAVHEDISYDEAVREVKAARPIVNPTNHYKCHALHYVIQAQP